jgi:hypothetical protein
MRYGKNMFFGLEVFADEFDYGYKGQAHLKSAGLSITSGFEGALDRVILYKAGIRIGYTKGIRKRFLLNAAIIPSIGYYPYSILLNDSTETNARYRNSTREIWYILIPPEQNDGLKFLTKGMLEGQYKMGKHISISLNAAYQQGFTPFVIDSMDIVRPHEPSGPKQHRYWTKVTGTSFQFHFGFKYSF